MLGAAFAALLIFAAIQDVKINIIPNYICAAVAVLALPRMLWGGESPIFALGGLCVAGLPLLIIWLIKKRSIGGGDIKLCAAAGLFIGTEGAAIMLFLASLAFYSISMYLQHKGRVKTGSSSAFGPYIAGGGIVTFILILLGG